LASIYFDQRWSDDKRRQALYDGDIFVYSPTAATQRLCALAREMLEDAFAPVDPQRVDQYLSMEETAAILARLKPAFIHRPECKSLIPTIIGDLGGDPDRIYFDVPRMRSAYPSHHLTSGIAYAFHPHRDTWYSAPMCQLNWWLPMFDITPENCFAIYPKYFSQAVENSSECYNYAEWNRTSRLSAATHVSADLREQPKLKQGIEPENIRVICPPGGIILFSGAHLHETIPNTSGVARYSIDFRTVHIDDLRQRHGARNVDSHCTGTTINDYLRCSDLEHIPESIVRSYESAT
jgi:hypothetical protein